MEKLNKYKKIQIVLLVLIVIASIAFARTLFKTQNTKNLATRETSIGATETMENPLDDTNTLTNEIEVTEQESDTSWDEENVEDTKVDMEEEKKEATNNTQYYIKVNYTANCVTVYKKDDSGNYIIPVKALICSTGTATPTSGVYKTSNKYRWHQLNGGVYGQYCTRITGHILFHSVPSSTQSPDSLKYVAYDKLGTRASAGCVRLTVEGAMWIYNNCASGTYVEFYSSSNPGPLGKPTAKKISSNIECRNWDPTDPDPRNPWHTYVESESTITESVPQTSEPQRIQEQPVIETSVTEPTQSEAPKHEEKTEQNNNTNTTKQEAPKSEEQKQEENTNTNTNTNTGNTDETPAQNTTKKENTSKDNKTEKEQSDNE